MNSKREIKRRPRRRRRTARAIGVAAIDRIADRIDLAIDLLTLGQYGLECRESPGRPEGTAGCGGSGRDGSTTRIGFGAVREAPRAPRRPSCEREPWAWPSRRIG